MGSEHYCLRWNNHQSNLLGVFSQLLQDESLVDVTLACSEGASIRAHKVVLSACSSYFQSLFLDHPARHPIVILKDVRFAELRTLVEFMYKGEVNVQYCQLSALLKTAESLKVKGLAEMTNQSTAPRESERDADRLRSHSSIPLKSEHSDTIPTSPLKTTLSTLATSGGVSGSSSREQQGSGERGTPSPTALRHHLSSSPTPLALYGSRRAPRDHPDRPPSMEVTMEDEPLRLSTQSTTATTTTTTVTCLPAEERPTSPDDDDEDDHMMQSNDVGLNMTLNSTVPATSSIVIPAASLSSSEVRPASRGGHTTATCISSSNSSGGGVGPPSQVSPSMPEPIAGPSGMGPVQQVPLSLKKEIDWDRGDDKDSSSSDYRHSHESIEDSAIPIFGTSLLSGGALGGPSRCPTPFAFPFAPLGLGLFDADPSRMLSFLHHHQSLLAEEALRYRGLFMNPKDSTNIRFNPLAEMFSKEQELLLKRANFFKNTFRYPLHATPDIFASTSASSSKDGASTSKDDRRSATTTYGQSKESQSSHRSFHSPTADKVVEKYDLTKPPTPTESFPGSSKDILDDILHKRSGNYLKESFRFNPLSGSDRRAMSPKDKSSSSTSSSPAIKPIPETLLLQDGTTIEEETKCTVCMATFPSVWLLEQHAALQHAGIGAMEEKPFICEQCGQSYRYRSAYVKHREQNHRARLPADKLFTCDVCGMQFRYLKSFKKHRLNHALERLHGKNEKKYGMELGTEVVTSSNDDDNELKITIKEEEDEEDQDDTVDSAGGNLCNTDPSADGDIVVPKITSSAETIEYPSTNSGSAMNEREVRQLSSHQSHSLHTFLIEIQPSFAGSLAEEAHGSLRSAHNLSQFPPHCRADPQRPGTGSQSPGGFDSQFPARGRRREAARSPLRVSLLRQVRALEGEPKAPRPEAHGRAPLRLPLLRPRLWRQVRPHAPPEDPHRGETIPLRGVRKVLRAS
ncbi:uncharacterized protein LOC132262249 isoform X1 [Phlebotomus argentipes]|uniref:uncharacterized protein LOC132262249 isoform X1 n=1 Tax=Phlebotomus argentipes TaxID=94469 RepID=UPI0028933808|nr:uncharacterized protein LOC132262249 isoform X1 [Phlebotomus argentipes]XP_059617434.1 uncharacterized protein LOC132262249 isoform X1 [Phlebotomus argentipes]XP_059617435.1 uncharacterized protein LOC132262249 isoform X1 [Phlebotomus argentipes]XP_059617436.1 uncharacterized protein LOC132262249 isoform X1 [Phlebotomus argentipes]XP_059617437.1 uncharacterized protein LOC132262249 isoform X1 [Phlebotomus argentipes]XP_059617438.1 uncharacterized protein LOC132262249 isoform X1 [Phlebotomus